MLTGFPVSFWKNAWNFSGAAVDIDFANNRGFNNGVYGTPAGLLTTTRASVAYEDDLNGNWTQFAANVPRLTNKGLLVEEARTNSIRNNSMQGAVVGTPGTPPTNWSIIDRSGLSHSVIGTGTESGIDYIDIRIFGTTTSAQTNSAFLYPEPGTQIATSGSGQTWANSFFVKIVGGSLANITFAQAVGANTAGGTLVEWVSTAGFVPSASGALGQNRVTATGTTANATDAFVQPQFWESFGNGVAIDVTLRIGWPQLEQGAAATSPIRTTAGAVTRAGDVTTLTSPPAFGAANSAFVAGQSAATSATPLPVVALAVTDGTLNNRLLLFRHVDTTGRGISTVAGVTAQANLAVWPTNTPGKLAGAFASADQAYSLNGSAIVATAGAWPPASLTAVQFGSQGAANFWDGYITRAAIWATQRLSNASLQAITT